ncbi:domain HDIG-containing protein [Candidatus Magnetobacterium bavaricum]|uniref:Domain HDIG-containing protein n=1 Tax=Candidatus Magnetobacterium bavaricum TaxID=29290 RepID=A0A0F3GUQ3_9BACT|nr:domain HDIG-containing protein [Candidatus Magnetobacterium bavaricum]
MMFLFSKVKLKELLTVFSKAMDYVDRVLSNHHLRVACIADDIAVAYNVSKQERVNIFLAAVLHDIGVFSLREKLELTHYELGSNPHVHAENGYLLIKDFKMFDDIANIIRYHHVPWDKGKGLSFRGMEVPIGARIIHLADRVEILINKEVEILGQYNSISRAIRSKSDSLFMPDMVEAFLEVASKECFWFDVSATEIDRTIELKGLMSDIELDISELASVSKLYSHIIDFRSRFTAMHSTGVSAVSSLLAQLVGFSEIECQMMSIAGHLHDIGKLSVPTELLEKPAKLTAEEFNIMKRHAYQSYRILGAVKNMETINAWASFHHERIDGAGYPFHLLGKDIPIGSRIMAVSDVFTAVTEDRPYRKGMSEQETLRLLQGMAAQKALDAEIVSIALSYIAELNDVRMALQAKAGSDYCNLRLTTT